MTTALISSFIKSDPPGLLFLRLLPATNTEKRTLPGQLGGWWAEVPVMFFPVSGTKGAGGSRRKIVDRTRRENHERRNHYYPQC